jgi:hypothetical protein
MPLTRHLYEMDEVVAALQLCLRNNWGRALFWSWELVVSAEEDLARNTLLDAWLRWGGGHDPTLLTLPHGQWIPLTSRIMAASAAAKSLTAERFLNLTAAMPSRPHMTPKPRGPRAAQRRNQRATAFVAALDAAEDISAADARRFWISLDAACRQQSRTDSMWLLQAAQPLLSADAIWSAIAIASRGGPATAAAIATLRQVASPHPQQQILHQAAAVLLLCTPTTARESMLVPPKQSFYFYERDWASWTANIGRRAARVHAIPADALHRETTRGSMAFKYTNIGDVRDPIPTLAEGCAYWRAELAAAGIEEDSETGALAFPDDETLESFYAEHFPDDIPDEWSDADQLKSHGRGCAEKALPALAPTIQIREERVSQRAWNCGTHVRC